MKNIEYYARVYEQNNIGYGKELSIAQYVNLNELIDFLDFVREEFKNKMLTIKINTIVNGNSVNEIYYNHDNSNAS